MSGHKFAITENFYALITMLHQFSKIYVIMTMNMIIDNDLIWKLKFQRNQKEFQIKYLLLYIFCRIISSLEQFAATTKLDNANSSLLIAPQVALGIYDVNETFPRGFAVFNGIQPGSGNARVMPINEEDLENATFIDSGIILSDGVIDLVKTFKGRCI